jgi:hypothetical protein
MSYQFVFNQYYIDLIKRVKSVAKKYKEANEMEKIELGRKVSRAIKDNYLTLDKSSDEYVKYINNIPSDFWSSYLAIEDLTHADKWFAQENVKDVELFEKISVETIRSMLKDDYLCHHFLTVFYIFKSEVSEEEIKVLIIVLQGTDKELTIDNLVNEEHKTIIRRLQDLRAKKIKDKTGMDMKGIEDTTLGRLAKEILEDVDVEKIQKSIGEKGDVLKAIGDPDSGFTELITNVSRKMADKISSGELKQETLLQDAMKFASVMPGLFGGNAGGNASGNGGNAGNAGNKGGNAGMPDMSAMMSMMSSMMGNKDGMDMFKQMAGNMKAPKGSKPSFNNSSLKKMAAAKKLKAKLNKKREAASEEN